MISSHLSVGLGTSYATVILTSKGMANNDFHAPLTEQLISPALIHLTGGPAAVDPKLSFLNTVQSIHTFKACTSALLKLPSLHPLTREPLTPKHDNTHVIMVICFFKVRQFRKLKHDLTILHVFQSDQT